MEAFYMTAKVKVARLSLFSNSILIILKLIVGLATGSVSIISEAIHSTIDLLAAIVAFFSIKISDKPADDIHPYGHGKIENISGVIESLLILVASFWIIIEAVKKIIVPGEVESIGLGFLVMFISSAINFIVSRKLYKVAKQEDSIALEADALHLKADVYTSLGVGIGLLIIWITKLNFLDPIVAILVSIFILKEAIELLISAFNPLLDVKLSNDEIKIIKDSINKFSAIYCNYHNFKTRKSGRVRYVELHLVFPENMRIKDAHDVCDKIEDDIKKSLNHSEIMIHLESSENNPNCDKCKNKCD
jgi:cation diffusion facilitator family transporter